MTTKNKIDCKNKKAYNSNINGVMAQLVAHLLCKQAVMGSNPFNSTININKRKTKMFGLSFVLTAKAIKRTAAKASGVIAIAIKKAIAIKPKQKESFFITT